MKRHAVIAVDENATYPIDGDTIGGMSDVMKTYLRDMGMDVVFSIQKAVWEVTCGGMSCLHDVCFSAPTGSGKTLAYALPILNALYKRQESFLLRGCLRCLVVLPTRGLALQVHSVMAPLGKALGLDSVVICGSLSVDIDIGNSFYTIQTKSVGFWGSPNTPPTNVTSTALSISASADRPKQYCFQYKESYIFCLIMYSMRFCGFVPWTLTAHFSVVCARSVFSFLFYGLLFLRYWCNKRKE